MRVGISGVGLVAALPGSPAAVAAALDAGQSGLRPPEGLLAELPLRGVGRAEVDVRPRLRRRKDRKLLPRAAKLAIEAGARALGDASGEEMGLFLGVGREPSGQQEVERALLRSHRAGELDPELLSTAGLAAYPPLAPLKTLPNMALAHVAIQLGLTGPGATRAGEEAAGLAALIEAMREIAEGRADAMLAGGAASRADAGSARDLVRLGLAGPDRAPGEAAALLRLESEARLRGSGRQPLGWLEAGRLGAGPPGGRPTLLAHEAGLGAVGAAAGPVELILELARGRGGRLDLYESSGARAWIQWSVPTA